MRVKYPRTMHFPWSPGLQNDDRVLPDPSCFSGKYIIMTEKMDGENTTMYRNGIHVRSLEDVASHPSRSWVQALHGRIKHEIPEGWRICGENMYAKHSIHYHNLASYFYVFSIWDEDNRCLSWADTKLWCELLELYHVPEIYEGPYDEETIRVKEYWFMFNFPRFLVEIEGYVVRNATSFHFQDFETNVAKYVRKDHVQTSEHWLNETLVPNLLKEDN